MRAKLLSKIPRDDIVYFRVRNKYHEEELMDEWSFDYRKERKHIVPFIHFLTHVGLQFSVYTTSKEAADFLEGYCRYYLGERQGEA